MLPAIFSTALNVCGYWPTRPSSATNAIRPGNSERMLRYVSAAARFVSPSARYWSNVRLAIRRQAPLGRSPNLRGFRGRSRRLARRPLGAAAPASEI